MAEATQPQVVILGGPNGAGKSTCAPLLLRDALDVEQFVNADVLAAGLSAYSKATVDFHAGRLMAQRLRELATRQESFGFETTLASRSYAAWLRRLLQTGYRVNVLYVWIGSPDLAIQRVKQRVAPGGAMTCRSQSFEGAIFAVREISFRSIDRSPIAGPYGRM